MSHSNGSRCWRRGGFTFYCGFVFMPIFFDDCDLQTNHVHKRQLRNQLPKLFARNNLNCAVGKLFRIHHTFQASIRAYIKTMFHSWDAKVTEQKRQEDNRIWSWPYREPFKSHFPISEAQTGPNKHTTGHKTYQAQISASAVVGPQETWRQMVSAACGIMYQLFAIHCRHPWGLNA